MIYTHIKYAIMIPNKQQQVVQLEIKMPYPLTNTQEVDLLTDLTQFDVNITYDKMRVFVKEYMVDYYLIPNNNFDGSQLSHWEKLLPSITIELYNPSIDYFKDEIVYLGGIIYKCIQNTVAGTLPNFVYWVAISGEQNSVRYLLNGVSSFILYTPIKNPIITCIEGTFTNGILDTDGLTKINNPQIVDISPKRRIDLVDNGGQAYSVEFWENELPYNFTGCLNIR